MVPEDRANGGADGPVHRSDKNLLSSLSMGNPDR